MVVSIRPKGDSEIRRRIRKQMPDQHQRQIEIVLANPHAAETRDIRHPAEIRIRHIRKPLFATRDVVPFEAYRPHDLCEGESEHRKIDLGQADAEESEDERHNPGNDTGCGEPRRKRHAVVLRQDGAGICPSREVRGVAERDQSGGSEQEVQAGREQRKDKDVGRERRIEP